MRKTSMAVVATLMMLSFWVPAASASHNCSELDTVCVYISAQETPTGSYQVFLQAIFEASLPNAHAAVYLNGLPYAHCTVGLSIGEGCFFDLEAATGDRCDIVEIEADSGLESVWYGIELCPAGGGHEH